MRITMLSLSVLAIACPALGATAPNAKPDPAAQPVLTARAIVLAAAAHVGGRLTTWEKPQLLQANAYVKEHVVGCRAIVSGYVTTVDERNPKSDTHAYEILLGRRLPTAKPPKGWKNEFATNVRALFGRRWLAKIGTLRLPKRDKAGKRTPGSCMVARGIVRSARLYVSHRNRLLSVSLSLRLDDCEIVTLTR